MVTWSVNLIIFGILYILISCIGNWNIYQSVSQTISFTGMKSQIRGLTPTPNSEVYLLEEGYSFLTLTNEDWNWTDSNQQSVGFYISEVARTPNPKAQKIQQQQFEIYPRPAAAKALLGCRQKKRLWWSTLPHTYTKVIYRRIEQI